MDLLTRLILMIAIVVGGMLSPRTLTRPETTPADASCCCDDTAAPCPLCQEQQTLTGLCPCSSPSKPPGSRGTGTSDLDRSLALARPVQIVKKASPRLRTTTHYALSNASSNIPRAAIPRRGQIVGSQTNPGPPPRTQLCIWTV